MIKHNQHSTLQDSEYQKINQTRLNTIWHKTVITITVKSIVLLSLLLLLASFNQTDSLVLLQVSEHANRLDAFL